MNTDLAKKIWPLILGGNDCRAVFLGKALSGTASETDFLTGLIRTSLSLQSRNEDLFASLEMPLLASNSLARLYLAAKKVSHYDTTATLLVLREDCLPKAPSIALAQTILTSLPVVDQKKILLLTEVVDDVAAKYHFTERCQFLQNEQGQEDPIRGYDSGYFLVRVDVLIDQMEAYFSRCSGWTGRVLTQEECVVAGIEKISVVDFLEQGASASLAQICKRSKLTASSETAPESDVEQNVVRLFEKNTQIWGDQEVLGYVSRGEKSLLTNLAPMAAVPEAFLADEIYSLKVIYGVIECVTEKGVYTVSSGEILTLYQEKVLHLENKQISDATFLQHVNAEEYIARDPSASHKLSYEAEKRGLK